MKKVLVTGGTGNLGRHLLSYLGKKRFQITVLSSGSNSKPLPDTAKIVYGDLANNIGLNEAVSDADTIVHCASDFRNFNSVDIKGTENLVHAAASASVKHIIYISIVGTDKSNFPYYQAKHKAERIIINSNIPYTILRSTQFHEFAVSILQTCIRKRNGKTVTVPAGLKFQTVSIVEVAEKLAELCEATPAGLLPDFAGPEILSFEEMASSYLKFAGSDYTLLFEKDKDELFNVFRSGINLNSENKYGKETWGDYLARADLKEFIK